MLKKLSVIILLSFTLSPVYSSIPFGGSNFANTSATRSYVKFAPQQSNINYNRRFMKQKSNYIYSPQQARYYGYRTPQQMGQPGYGYQGSYSEHYHGYGR